MDIFFNHSLLKFLINESKSKIQKTAKFKDLIPYNSVIDMPELINNGKKARLNIGVFPIHEHWSDIGRPEDL